MQSFERSRRFEKVLLKSLHCSRTLRVRFKSPPFRGGSETASKVLLLNLDDSRWGLFRLQPTVSSGCRSN